MDRFRPQANLPLDPFASMEPSFGRPAWVLDAEDLNQPSTSRPRDVVLIVGDLSPAVLKPTLTSQQLTNSLVILATGPGLPAVHLAPVQTTTCTVRVLRLSSPLNVHDGGGALFLQVLERAERISKLWRAGHDKGPKVAEVSLDEHAHVASPRVSHSRSASKTQPSLREKGSDGSLRSLWMTPPSLHSRSPTSSPRNSIVLSDSGAPSTNASPNTSSSSLPATANGSLKSSSGTIRGKRQPTGDVRSRPFDALFNVLPSAQHTGPKVMLKQAIMVTTLARPFLVLPPSSIQTSMPLARQPSVSRPRAGSNPQESRRWSALNPASGSSTRSSTPTGTPPSSASPPNGRPVSAYFPSTTSVPAVKPRASHILHVVPRFSHSGDHDALVRALEAFILNFSDSHGPMSAPLPVIVDDVALGQTTFGDHTVLDCLVGGALDRNAARGRALERRAWLAGARDIREATAADDAPTPVASTPSASYGGQHLRASTTSAAMTKGKPRAPLRASSLSPETALPSPPPSPPLLPSTPAVMLTPPSAIDHHHHLSPSSGIPSPAGSSDDSHQLFAPQAQQVRRIPSDGSGDVRSLGVRPSKSEPVLGSNARSEKKSRKWWWPFKSSWARTPSSLGVQKV